MRKILFRTGVSGLFVVFLFLSAVAGFGQTAREIQERMRERLPEIDALKKEQLVGENNKGFLEPFEGLNRAQQALVKEENEDRKRVYEAVAAQTRATPEEVGVVRARQIAERSAAGVLIQNSRGQWVENLR